MEEIQNLINKIGDIPFITDRKKEAEYIKKAQKGDKESQHILVCSNILLIVKLASDYKRYVEASSNKSLDIHDLVMEGVFGIYNAIEKYDFSKKVNGKSVKFTTYAWWWIKLYMQRAVEKHGSLVYRPASVRQEIKNYYECVNNSSCDLGRMPSEEELLDNLKWTKSKLERVWKAIILSDDKIVRDNDEHTINDHIKNGDDHVGGYCEKDNRGVIQKYITTLMNKLDKRHREVIKRRFGIGCERETLESVGDLLGVSKERIRQIETVAMNKMRDSVTSTDRCVLLGYSK
jgi:RNA polymerase sigma factor (sigma-70 family)